MKKVILATVLILLSSLKALGFYQIDLSSPKKSFETFYSAMKDYSKGVQTDDKELKLRLNDALEVLELDQTESALTQNQLEEKAILIKEVLDRTLKPGEVTFDSGKVEGTNIYFVKRKDWYYISEFTINRIEKDYNSVINEPYLEGIEYPGASHENTLIENIFPQGNTVKYFGVTQIQWVLIILSIISAVIIYFFLVSFLGLLEKLMFSKNEISLKIADALTEPISIFASAFFLQAVGVQIALSGDAKFMWFAFTKILFSVGCFWLLYCLIAPIESALLNLTERTESELDDNLVPLITKTSRVIVVLLAALTIIQSLGVNVFSLLAGIGVGGLAIALAAKDTAANFFGSLMILFDQPFKVGEWIKIGDLEGTVEEIGFRSTRVRTFYDSQIVIPNSTVANSDIDNLGRRQFRRTLETLGVTYSTTEQQIKDFNSRIRNLLDSHPKVRSDKYHVAFKRFGDSALEVILYFFLDVSSYGEELEEKEKILLEIKKIAEELGVSFAFPSHSLYFENSIRTQTEER
jgi:MscS family membrane protein